MKTTIRKKEEIPRKWHIIDANNKVLGRMCTTIANVLRGKNKPIFSPHMDCGDFVIVINAEKIKLTGNKKEGKLYYRHSGYPGGLKSKPAGEILAHNPEKIIETAVSGMLPKNKLRSKFLEKLKVYAGEEHPHQAQNPEILEV